MTREERAARVPALRERIGAFCDAQFGTSVTEVFEDGSRAHYAPPSVFPSAVPHPRVMVTPEMLPGIRAAMENPDCALAVAEYRRLLENDSDCVLVPPFEHGENGPVHNFNELLLSVIEARTVEYLLTGEEYWGYSAILGMMNYLLTFEIGWINCDAFRVYGMVMYTAALVYDRCHALLSADDKRRIVLGVEHRLCRGISSMPERAREGGVKMEMGFPPCDQGPVSGHGCEMTLLRDYLAFSIAIADEYPGWWNYVGARIEIEYIPVRRVFYAAGRYPQGRSYSVFRFISDLWSACLLTPIYGKNPYPEADMKRIVHSMLAQETDVGCAFPSGDGGGLAFGGIESSRLGNCLAFSAYLFNDPVARAATKRIGTGFTKFENGTISVTATLALILASRGTASVESDRGALPLVHRNRGYFNQYISRPSAEDGSPVVLMKAGGRYTSNHEHANAGHFQIWYKGYLTGDTGVYQGYGSDNHSYFHVQSIAHNVPLVFNPAHRDEALTPNASGRITWDEKARYWYSGGQRRPTPFAEISGLEMWHGAEYVSAIAPIMQSESEGGAPIYAYISTDITPAYEPDTVKYLKRSMITSYKTDRGTPVALFVFDRIEAVDPSFKKTFLLQITGEAAPSIREDTVTTVNGGGKLTLTAVTPSSVTALGGEGQNYLVNGVQCQARHPAKTWGRVEISPIGERKIDHMLNVLTVCDADAEPAPVTRIDCGDDCEGAYVAGNAAIFRKSREELGTDIVFTLPAPAYTYFSGLNEGEFAVLRNGETLATLTVGDGQNLAAAALPSGTLLLKKLS